MAYDREQRDELDERVRGIDWNKEALEPNSPERRMVAGWLEESGLVRQQVRRWFPDPEQAARIFEFTAPRITEKILHKTIVSKEKQVNEKGWWDPTLGTSFCAWAKKTSEAVARANPRRVLSRKAVNASALDRDDDEGTDVYNKAFDDALSRNLMAVDAPALFETHPDLTVPRPVGRGLKELRAMFDADPSHAAAWAYRHGLWHRSLDELEPAVAVALMTQPLKPARAALLPELMPEDPELAREYAASQTASRKYDAERLRRLVRRRAEADGVPEWDVWCRLGTLAAQLLAG